MNIFVVAVGSYGDVLPLLGLALELQKRGYAITFFTNDHFAELVRRSGLDFIPLGTAAEYDAIANNPDLWHPQKGWRVIGTKAVSNALKESYDILRSKIIPGKTIMVSSTLGFAVRLIQETHSIPTATVHMSPGVFYSAHQAPKMPGLSMPDWWPVILKRGIWNVLNHTLIDPVVKPKLNRFRRDLELHAVSRIFHDWVHSPDLVLCLFPTWFGNPQPDWPPQTRLTGFPLYDKAHDSILSGEIERFLERGPPPLVFTPGSANKQGRQFFVEGIKACQLLGRRGMLLTWYPEQLPSSLPDTIKHFSYVPLSTVLHRCAALIHHGGIGTCAQALRAGIPQLIQPLAFDQYDNAARVHRLGVGTKIPRRSFRAALIASRIQDLLDSPRVIYDCQTIAKKFYNVLPLEECCNLIESTLIHK